MGPERSASDIDFPNSHHRVEVFESTGCICDAARERSSHEAGGARNQNNRADYERETTERYPPDHGTISSFSVSCVGFGLHCSDTIAKDRQLTCYHRLRGPAESRISKRALGNAPAFSPARAAD